MQKFMLHKLLRFIIFTMPAGFPTCVQADVPPCFPGALEPNVERFFPYLVFDNQENCAAVWFCPDTTGHKWVRWAFVGHGNNVDNCEYGYAKAVAAMFMSRDDKIALYKKRTVDDIETDPVKQAQYQAQDAPALALALTVPYPTTIPPSGLVTTIETVYYIVQQSGKLIMLPVGTVPLGTPLDTTQSANGYYSVNTSAVIWYGKTHPFIVFGK